MSAKLCKNFEVAKFFSHFFKKITHVSDLNKQIQA